MKHFNWLNQIFLLSIRVLKTSKALCFAAIFVYTIWANSSTRSSKNIYCAIIRAFNGGKITATMQQKKNKCSLRYLIYVKHAMWEPWSSGYGMRLTI